MDIKSIAKSLVDWYRHEQRPLPWRINRNPYRIWISEVMLQQTTVQAVIPYYERFMLRFPDVETLAQAKIDEVYELWTGLGYYSRARNLHLAAQSLRGGFPKTYVELMELPGFGPYTARAVSSLAFGENVGVIDGNVIRVLTRHLGRRTQWWKPEERNWLQNIADQLANTADPHQLNQAMMELGATICTPKKPACLLCPLQKDCLASKKNLVDQIPLKKLRRLQEIWVWHPEIFVKKDKVALVENDYAPFLRGQWIFPGQIKKAKTKPKIFQNKHVITHHDIYIIPQMKKPRGKTDYRWVAMDQIHLVNPSILLRKALPE
jgi:A/G-specific adenine glycosylase